MKWHVSCKVISSDYVFLRWPSPEGVSQKLQASTFVHWRCGMDNSAVLLHTVAATVDQEDRVITNSMHAASVGHHLLSTGCRLAD
jgi:hypothetical protein